MIALAIKEIRSFFSTAVGYLVIGLFLLICGLFLWVFPGPYNIFDTGFADLSGFFGLAPWILLFLVPAVCMKAFSEEFKLGTIELLFTKPMSLWSIILGKYLGALTLILLALAPTLLYVITVDALGRPPGNWDLGNTLGSYFGLLFLVLAYTAIGLLASSLSQSQVVAFISGAFLCFLFYFGFQGLSDLSNWAFVEDLGLKAHFDSIARGVIDSRDLIYFLSVSVLFLSLAHYRLKRYR